MARFSKLLTPGSLVACRSTASASARLILSQVTAARADPAESTSQQAFDPPSTCFTVTLLSTLASPQVSAPGTALAVTPLLEVRSAKVRPSPPRSPSARLLGGEAPSPRESPFQLG